MDSLLNWLLQGAVVGLVAAAGLRAIPVAWTGPRSAFLWTAYAVVLGLPAVPWLADALSPEASAGLTAPVALTITAPVVAMPDSWWTSPALVAACWLAWAVVAAMRLGSDFVAVRSARRACRPCPPSVEARLPHWRRVSAAGRPTRMMLSTRVGSAAVLGGGPPLIAIDPALFDRLDDADLDRVVVHEWAHVQRRDDLVHAVQLLLRIPMGWHPVVWWLDRQLTLEREAGCDRLAVRVTGSARQYASCLATLAALPRQAAGLRALAAAAPSGLRRRVVRILARPGSAAVRSGWLTTLGATATVAGCALVVGHVNLVGAIDAAAAPPRQPTVAAAGVVGPAFPDALATEPRSPMVPDRRPATPGAAPPAVPVINEPSIGSAAPGEPIVVAAPVPAFDRPEHPDGVSGLPLLPAASAAAVAVPAAFVPAPASPESKPRAPWTAAADAGVAIGRASQTAGVATGGFFKRLSQKIAGSVSNY